MNKTRLYLYDKTKESNGYRGTDLSSYVMQGDELAERLNNELDTAFVTLAGYSEKEGFAPTTKMIMDKVTDGVIVATYHWMVDEDLVEKPILSDDTYFDHHISLIEPSVVAQKRPVDNIAVTYKLKDVSLQTLPAFDTEEVAVPSNRKSEYTPSENFGIKEESSIIYFRRTTRFGKYFSFGDIKFGGGNKKYFKMNESGETITITLPSVSIYFGSPNTKNFSNIGDASIDYSITESRISDQNTVLRSWSGSIISNSQFSETTYAWQDFPDVSDDKKCFLPEYVQGGIAPTYYAKKYTDPSKQSPSYTATIPAKPDMVYTIRVSLHDFGEIPTAVSPTLTSNYKPYSGKPSGETYTQYDRVSFPSAETSIDGEILRTIEEDQSSMTVSFQTYSKSTTSYLYQSSIPYSALDLIAKAVTNSVILPKKSGVCIGDINSRDASGKLTSNLPFYVDPNYVNALANTQVIENFYSQKNLWEILVEAGNYIHSIPEIKFGEDDRFMITFSPLGRTDEKMSANRPQSIMNFQGVQDYVSSVSSYITNMVQLGGQVSEWIAPKTTSEQYLVYNDTVSLIVSKPIIELLSIIVKCNSSSYTGIGISNGATADMTQYVFEENVYKVIDIDPAVIPNKGVSLYYSLSDNVIRGCDFRTPTANTGDVQDDYAIKKVIYSAFKGYTASTSTSPWKDIKVNDFTFLVTYRTKDSVRVSQSRPDIRKYLMASRFDPYPINGQFNNQEDTLVDSVKFGLNVYGKLIRTGNKEYTVTEWSPNWNSVRRKGELYRINGDLYYAARIHSVCYSEHIESEVTFSKDFNALSSVIGIPSEPRFYEISEQSAIRREVEINDILYLTTAPADDLTTSQTEMYRRTSKIFDLIFSGAEYAKYALTAFKGDKDSAEKISNVYGEPTFLKEIVTPLSSYSCGTTLTYTWDMADNYGAGDKVSEVEGTLPGTINYRSLSAVPYTDIYGKAPLIDFFLLSDIGNISDSQIRKIPESWITEDDMAVTAIAGTPQEETSTITLSSLSIENSNFDKGQKIILSGSNDYAVITALPGSSSIVVSYDPGSEWSTLVPKTQITFYTAKSKGKEDIKAHARNIWASNYIIPTNGINADINGRGLQLFKDNREAVSFNYNVQMATSSDQFVVSPFVFAAGKTNVKVVLLSEEVNKITSGYINTSAIIAPRGPDGAYLPSKFLTVNYREAPCGAYLPISFIRSKINSNHFNAPESGYAQVRAIALVYDIETSGAYRAKFIIARNIPKGTDDSEATRNWVLGTPNKSHVFRV